MSITKHKCGGRPRMCYFNSPVSIYVCPGCLIPSRYHKSIYSSELKGNMWSCLSNSQLTEKCTLVKVSPADGASRCVSYVLRRLRTNVISVSDDVKRRNVISLRNTSHTVKYLLQWFLLLLLVLLQPQWQNKLSAGLTYKYCRNTSYYLSSVTLTFTVLAATVLVVVWIISIFLWESLYVFRGLGIKFDFQQPVVHLFLCMVHKNNIDHCEKLDHNDWCS